MSQACGIDGVTAWVTYRRARDWTADAADLVAHGVGGVSVHDVAGADYAESVNLARQWLERARAAGLKLHLDIPEITEQAHLINRLDCERVDALMIGGCYQGRAIDRHLFAFAAAPQRIVIEPPVYNPRFAYRRRGKDGGTDGEGEPIAHYYPDMPAPVRAEVIVPLRPYDGAQHLAIRPARIAPAPDGTQPEHDSAAGLDPVAELRDRRLYTLEFDLTGLDGAQLDRVGLAVYWPYHGTDHWIFGRGTASAWADGTAEALRRQVRHMAGLWREANGGAFPSDVIPMARFGDECFFITGHTWSPAVSFPLWDYSAPALDAFARAAPGLAHPRTWGYPEIYGTAAYAHWRHNLHAGCARLCEIIRATLADCAPGVRLFRNTTRMGVFDTSNDHDGSGQDLLAQAVDIVHLDPYPVGARGMDHAIVRDMSYCAGLARRHGRLLMPWMQAHTYGGPGGLQHVTPEQVRRMGAQHRAQGVDAVIWLGYGKGYTFPLTQPESWAEAGRFHAGLASQPSPKPRARLAVLRPYAVWALASLEGERIRNPADWLLQQWLEVWAVWYGQPYDVFELPPGADAARDPELARALAAYDFVVGTAERPGAWVIGRDTQGTTDDPARADAVRLDFERALFERGWITKGSQRHDANL